ncbi:tyrosine-type recombinase/integrase [Cytobacillus dafuensis]|uniref:Tyrosine-type recombinase/integrase n=1 Tax=Cytobacillus dafuensis TaxID=1742359 RepID=A0A5B8Z496_CYTDA|nr:site-specific integrase [Cytobacillus dafuensis]QED47751.1 tyrosine-type recombinase/integrase [Cytobacillus dafuensis]
MTKQDTNPKAIKNENESLTNDYAHPPQDIEDLIHPSSLVIDAFNHMKEYKDWSLSTIDDYVQDVQHYSSFCYNIKKEPILSMARLHIVNQWIQQQKEAGVAVATIQRRLASLSSIYKFYKELGKVAVNSFKIAELPIGLKGHHSRDLGIEELIKVYSCLYQMKEDGFDVGITVHVMLTTGLRNKALTELKVKDVDFKEQVIHYNIGIFNSKHKIQVFPVPPKLLTRLKEQIRSYQLQPEDTLLVGLKGYPLRAKQLNRITDKIFQYLDWSGDLHVTPHGFRASIATILHERDVSRDDIKLLLGHSDKIDNLHFYLRRHRKELNRLRHELTLIEQEIEEGVELLKGREGKNIANKEDAEVVVLHNPVKEAPSNHSNMISQEEFLRIMKVNKTAAMALLEQNLVTFE